MAKRKRKDVKNPQTVRRSKRIKNIEIKSKAPEIVEESSSEEEKIDVAMYSTRPRSAAKRAWVGLLKDKSLKSDRWYSFSDGSSTGWHAAVIIPPKRDQVHFVAKWLDHEGTRNVSAEAAAYLLALQNLPSEAKTLINVSDFLFVGAHDTDNRNAHHKLIKRIYKDAREIREGRSLEVTHIHHPGHQKDSSDFTKFNHLVDHTAGLRREVSCLIPYKKALKLLKNVKEFDAEIQKFEH